MRVSVFVFICLGVLACAEQSNKGEVILVMQSERCQLQSAGLQVIETTQQLRSILAPVGQIPLSSEASLPDLPSLNTDRYRYLLLSDGQKPTPGYRFALLTSQMVVKNGQAQLPVRLVPPSASLYQAQVISRPCALLALPVSGYQSVAAMSHTLEINQGR